MDEACVLDASASADAFFIPWEDKIMKKRIISLLLAVIMMFSTVPMLATAYTSDTGYPLSIGKVIEAYDNCDRFGNNVEATITVAKLDGTLEELTIDTTVNSLVGDEVACVWEGSAAKFIDNSDSGEIYFDYTYDIVSDYTIVGNYIYYEVDETSGQVIRVVALEEIGTYSPHNSTSDWQTEIYENNLCYSKENGFYISYDGYRVVGLLTDVADDFVGMYYEVNADGELETAYYNSSDIPEFANRGKMLLVYRDDVIVAMIVLEMPEFPGQKVFGVITSYATVAGEKEKNGKPTYRVEIKMLVDGQSQTYYTEDFLPEKLPVIEFDELDLTGLTIDQFAYLQIEGNGKVEVCNEYITIDYLTYDDLLYGIATNLRGDYATVRNVISFSNPVPAGWTIDKEGRPVYNDSASDGAIQIGSTSTQRKCDETKFITISSKLEDVDGYSGLFQPVSASEITAGGSIELSDFDNDIYYIFAYTTFAVGEAKNPDNEGTLKEVLIFPRLMLRPHDVPADYTAVEEALAKVPSDLSKYTDESALHVLNAVDEVIYDLKADQQTKVDGFATAIEDAVSNLQYKPADYTAVEEALAKVPADLTIYTAETAQAVTDAVNAVVYDLTIDKQATVDAYAKAIEDAVASLEIPGVIKVSDSLVNYRLRCTTKVVDGNLVLTATTAGTSSMKVRLGNLPEGATVAMVGTNANASMASGIITVTNPGMKNVNVPMTITAADGAVTEFVLVADFGNAIRYATYARLAQTGNNITVTSGAATAYVLFDTTEIDGGYVEVENVSRNLLGRYVISGSAVRFYNPVYDEGTVTVNVKNANGETVETYGVTVIFADATEYTAVLDTSLRCTYEVDGDNITVTANASVSNVYLNFGRYYSESLSASVNNDIIKKMGARSWRIMACDEPVEFDLYFDATAYDAEKVTRHVTVNF